MEERAGIGRLGPALLLAALLAMTFVATWAAARRVDERENDQLRASARSAATAIDGRLRDYVQILHGTAGLYAASHEVTNAEFRRFFAEQHVLERFPGVQTVGSATHLQQRDLAAYVARVRQESAEPGGYPTAFRVHPAPEPSTQDLLVIDRLEPAAGNAQAFGLDFLAEPVRRRTALLARRTGEPAASAPVQLVTGGPGFIIMVPTYGGPPSRTGDLRPWTGVVYAAFRADHLLGAALGPLERGVDIDVYDLGSAAIVGPTRHIGRQAQPFGDEPAGDAPAEGGHTRIESLEVAGRRWAIVYAHEGSVLPAGERLVPWVIGIAGLLVSLLGAALLRALTTSRARAVRLAERMTVELREREGELQRSNAELEHFAYLASHDLQEPLRTITSYVGLLRRRAGDQLDERATSWLGYVGDGAERMSQLIADLLEYSRSGRGAEEPQATDAGEAWDVAVANLRGAIDEAGATVTRDALPVVVARPRDLTSVLQNLIGNGLKYRDTRAPEVHATARRVGEAWEIAVRDNGIGIDPQHHERVFGLFQRLHTAEQYPGTGMGLAIVKKIVESNGGGVRVESRASAGATFVVTLPAGEEA